MKNIFPKVSVVMITYGHHNYIIGATKSVVLQNYDGIIELIIANDCSPDNTDEIINNYMENKSIPDNIEIKYTCHLKNMGMMPNSFYALRQVTGKYIAVCQGDDYWIHTLKLKKQVNFLEENPDYEIIFTNVNVIYEDGMENKVSTLTPVKKDRECTRVEILQKWCANTSTLVFRNNDNIVGKYENFYNIYKFSYGDTPLFIYLLQFGNAYGFIDYTSSYRRLLGGALRGRDAIKNVLDYIVYLKSINKAFNNKKYIRINNNNRIRAANSGVFSG